VHHSGKRAAAISGSLSGGTSFCETGSCVPNPTNPVKDTAGTRFMLPPHWKSETPIAVTAGKAYQLSFWVSTSQLTVGKGFDGIVRWVDGGGATVAQQKLIDFAVGGTQDWKKYTYPKVAAPAGATGAVLLLGQSDDLWTGQVVFDDVYFGTYTLA
jgi:hypothetical protein